MDELQNEGFGFLVGERAELLGRIDELEECLPDAIGVIEPPLRHLPLRAKYENR